MTILEELLAPKTLHEFEQQVLFQKPFACPNKARRFYQWISWPTLFEIFSQGYNNCWLPKQGHLPSTPELQSGVLTPEQAVGAFNQGRSILVRHAEQAHPRLKDVAQDFQDLFSDPIDIQLYVTPAGQEGFDWHYDLEEVFVIQTSGEKEFFLRTPTKKPPLDRLVLPKTLNFDKDFIGGEIRCHLKAGDWLYIPAGVWHKARAHTHSFHMSIGVMSSKRKRILH